GSGAGQRAVSGRRSAVRRMTVRASRMLMRGLTFSVGLAAAVACSSVAPRTAATADTVAQAPPPPDSFRVTFVASRGPFVVEVTRAWAPFGADRFRELVQTHFFDDERFFRVIP